MSDMPWSTPEDVLTKERYNLMVDRIGRIPTDRLVPEIYQDYFEKGAACLLKAAEIYEKKADGSLAGRTMDECRADHDILYRHLYPENYDTSYANPSYAVSVFGTEAGQLLTLLCSEMDNCTAYAFQGMQQELTLYMELFVQIYNCLEMEDLNEAREDVYWFFHDYCDLFVETQIHDMICPKDNFFADIVMNADLTDLRYLYLYGLPVGDNELHIAEFLNRMPEDKVRAMADTYTEGYRLGFEAAGIDLSKKGTVEVDFPIGFERMIRIAVENFRKMGLEVVMAREPSSSFFGKGGRKRAVYSTSVNRQYDFDHREDMAYFLDKAFVERRLEAYRTVFEQHKEEARLYAGPALVEVFGEIPFSPEAKGEVIRYDLEQQELGIYMNTEAGLILYTYIPGEERSFTIIAYPMPEIGDRFEEIFEETVAINTLDYQKYQQMQQSMIDVLDGAKEVRIVGRGDNRTDLTVAVRQLADPEYESAFENCVADVNIPVGEVFTSPVLEGTNGVLHVSGVYLEGLYFRDLELTFEDGMVTSYTCANYEDEDEDRRFIRENIMMRYETLPLGEFSIGTNTTAYRMAKKYDIGARMPILIAEKTGPHFAVGDTCYSHEEEVVRRNPDGKVIVAKDNEISAMREEDPAGSYFNCHTDITIPFEEVGAITAVYPDGSSVDIIRDGLFRVEGSEDLNIPLLEMGKEDSSCRE